MQFRAVGSPQRIDHDALDVRLHCGYSNDMNNAAETNAVARVLNACVALPMRAGVAQVLVARLGVKKVSEMSHRDIAQLVASLLEAVQS